MTTGNHAQPVDVAIVGAGLAGLTAANLLAQEGLSVVVFERLRTVGGRAATRRDRGYSLNLGPHALYRAGAAARVLGQLGLEPAGSRTTGDGTFAILGGKRHPLPSHTWKLLSTSLLPLAAKIEAARLFARFHTIDSAALEHVPAEAWIEKAARRPEVRALLRGLFRLTTYAANLKALSAGAGVRQVQLGIGGGVRYLDGGWQSMVDLLAERAREHGARIVESAPVTFVDYGDSVRGIHRADGSFVEASTVILATDPATAQRVTARNGVSPFDRAAKNAVPVLAASLDLALDGGARRANFAIGLDQPLYFSVHSAWADLAPAGGTVIHAAKYLDTAPGRATGAIRAELEALVDSIVPDWREHVVTERFLPSLVVSNALVTAKDGYSGRQTVTTPGIRGLFVAGDWVGSEGILADASFASAQQAATELIATGGSRVAAA